MTFVFISHSSEDKIFVNKLEKDLKQLELDVWVDDGEIDYGDSITSEIQDGLSNADYLLLILTHKSMSSEWVKREWAAIYQREIQEKRQIIIPILLEDCEIPTLLKERKYVDFRNDKKYPLNLVKLTRKLDNSTYNSNDETEEVEDNEQSVDELSTLLEKVSDKSQPLSQSILSALSFGRKYGHERLIRFCKDELNGWKKYPQDMPTYRCIDSYFSIYPINNQSVLWGENASNMFSFMESSEEFKRRKTFLYQPISVLEEIKTPDPVKGYLSWSETHNFKGNDITIYCYSQQDAYEKAIELIRAELITILIDL